MPVHDDRTLFEFLILEGAQAGLSWSTILNKRENYRQAFDGFDPRARGALRPPQNRATVARSRHRPQQTQRSPSAVANAKAFLRVQKEFGSFDRYIWQFVDGKPRVNSPKSLKQVPARTPESDAMSKDLKRRGFKFVGSTICYAFMQAVGHGERPRRRLLPPSSQSSRSGGRIHPARAKTSFRFITKRWNSRGRAALRAALSHAIDPGFSP